MEVDLDFEHNVRPAPVITEEVTASIEDIIKKRIIEVTNMLNWHGLDFYYNTSSYLHKWKQIYRWQHIQFL